MTTLNQVINNIEYQQNNIDDIDIETPKEFTFYFPNITNNIYENHLSIVLNGFEIEEYIDNDKIKIVGDYIQLKTINTEFCCYIGEEYNFLTSIYDYYVENNIPMDKFSMKILDKQGEKRKLRDI